MKLTWPAPERNKAAILAVLQRVLPARGTLLEIASGTGQHAAYFAEHLAHWIVQPSDLDAPNLASIRARILESQLSNLREPLVIDACDAGWPVDEVDAVFNANLIHIAPWAAALGLVRGASLHLKSGGVLVVYGPFRIGGKHTAPSNEQFDRDLRERDARFGVRDLEEVVTIAEQQGLTLSERVPMPANNQTLIFRRV